MLTTAGVSTTPHWRVLTMRAYISGSMTTFGSLHDVLLTHVHGVVIPLAQLMPK